MAFDIAHNIDIVFSPRGLTGILQQEQTLIGRQCQGPAGTV